MKITILRQYIRKMKMILKCLKCFSFQGGRRKMEILKGLDIKVKNSAVSLGKFDGVHRGHRLLLNGISERKDLVPTVFTF